MKKGTYFCDGGSIMIRVCATTISIPNGYGDGMFTVYVSGEQEEHPDCFEFVCHVEGEFEICRYDCDDNSLVLLDTDEAARLEGEYGVYVHEGDIFFEQW